MNDHVKMHYAGSNRLIMAEFAICNVTSAKMLHFKKCLFHFAKRVH